MGAGRHGALGRRGRPGLQDGRRPVGLRALPAASTSPDDVAAGLDDDALDPAVQRVRRGRARRSTTSVVRRRRATGSSSPRRCARRSPAKLGASCPCVATLQGRRAASGQRYRPPFDVYAARPRRRAAAADDAVLARAGGGLRRRSTPAPASSTSRRPSARTTTSCIAQDAAYASLERAAAVRGRPDGTLRRADGRALRRPLRQGRRPGPHRATLQGARPARPRARPTATTTRSAGAPTTTRSSSTRARRGSSARPTRSRRRIANNRRDQLAARAHQGRPLRRLPRATTSTGRSRASATGARRSTSGSTTRPAHMRRAGLGRRDPREATRTRSTHSTRRRPRIPTLSRPPDASTSRGSTR